MSQMKKQDKTPEKQLNEVETGNLPEKKNNDSEDIAQVAASRRTKHGREELPQVRGQGQWPRVPGCDGTGTAKRSYSASEVNRNGQMEIPLT